MKILVVDDQEESRKYMRYLLQSHDCTVVEACDGLEGLEKIRETHPDLVISDSLMPRMDGFQLLMEVKRDSTTREIPFIFYSGNYIGEQDADLALSLGAKAYIFKPKQPWELWHEIQKCLRQVSEKGVAHTATDPEEHLKLYGKVVADKLDEKIRELEQEIVQRREAEKRLHALSGNLFEKLELERRHIARELHDDIGQSLTAVKLNLQSIIRSVDSAELSMLLRDSIEGIDRILQGVRNLSLNLRPALLDDLGLPAALRWLIDRTVKSAGISAEFYSDEMPDRLPFDIETACFRIAQEALNNVVRHADAAHSTVNLMISADRVEMTISDDGVGFDLEERISRSAKGESFGLLGMRERAELIGGQLDITTVRGRGTVITVLFPF